MSGREPVKIVEPGLIPKIVLAVSVFAICLAGISRAGSVIFAPKAGSGEIFREPFAAGVSAAKGALTLARAELSGSFDRQNRITEHPAGQDAKISPIAAENPIPAGSVGPPVRPSPKQVRAMADLPGSAAAAPALATQLLTRETTDNGQHATDDQIAPTAVAAVTDFAGKNIDPQTAAQLGTLGTATGSFWQTAWEKIWPFIRQAAIWCWGEIKHVAAYTADAFRPDDTGSALNAPRGSASPAM